MPIPLIPLITTAISALSSASKKAQAKRDEKQLEESLNGTPKYRPNQSILDYYDTALQRFNTSPTDTAGYKRDSQNIRQGTTQALSSLNKLRSGDVANVIQGQNNSLLKAAVNAENRKAQELGIVGQAAGMKAAEEKTGFNQNELYPFEAKYNLLAMKSAAQRASERQETSNAYQNGNAASTLLGDDDTIPKFRFNNRYGSQGKNAYGWARINDINFGQYAKQASKVGKSLINFGY